MTKPYPFTPLSDATLLEFGFTQNNTIWECKSLKLQFKNRPSVYDIINTLEHRVYKRAYNEGYQDAQEE